MIVGLDMREVPPVSLGAHRTCLEARSWRGFAVVRPGQSVAEVFDPKRRQQLEPSTNAGAHEPAANAERTPAFETLAMFG